MRRARLPLTLALALAAGVAGAGRAARAADVEGHIDTGLVMGFNVGQLKAPYMIGGDVSTWWSPRADLQVGLQTGIGITYAPYGDGTDGPAPIGKVGDDGVTLLPRALFGARIPLWHATTLGAFVGSTFIVAPDMGAYSAMPYPTASIALDSKFGPPGRFGLRASLSYIQFIYGDTSRVILSPALAFSWR
jgi:hypothetical protein